MYSLEICYETQEEYTNINNYFVVALGWFQGVLKPTIPIEYRLAW